MLIKKDPLKRLGRYSRLAGLASFLLMVCGLATNHDGVFAVGVCGIGGSVIALATLGVLIAARWVRRRARAGWTVDDDLPGPHERPDVYGAAPR